MSSEYVEFKPIMKVTETPFPNCIPVGHVLPYTAKKAPQGWVFINGQKISYLEKKYPDIRGILSRMYPNKKRMPIPEKMVYKGMFSHPSMRKKP